MSTKVDTKSIVYLKEHTEELVLQVNETKEPIFITQNKESKAVILDIESYNKLLDSADLNKMIAHKSEDIKLINQSDEFLEQSSFFKEFKELTSK